MRLLTRSTAPCRACGATATPTVPAAHLRLVCTVEQAHRTAVSSLLAAEQHGHELTIVSAGMDKTVAAWSVQLKDGRGEARLRGRVRVPGDVPAFSLAAQPAAGPHPACCLGAVLVGTGAKEVVSLALRDVDAGSAPHQQVPALRRHTQAASGYTGWVKSLALLHSRWLLSCGCNYLRVHGAALPLGAAPFPERQTLELFKGDIQQVVATDQVVVDDSGGGGGGGGGGEAWALVHAVTSDGALYCWRVLEGDAGGEGGRGDLLEQAAVAPQAHGGRISAVAVDAAAGVVYTAGLADGGQLRAWDACTLEPLAAVSGAHGPGGRVHSLALGPGGVLWSAGDDQAIRRWRPVRRRRDRPAGAARGKGAEGLEEAGPPLTGGHASSVRCLVKTERCLVSGDAVGRICVWWLHDHPS